MIKKINIVIFIKRWPKCIIELEFASWCGAFVIFHPGCEILVKSVDGVWRCSWCVVEISGGKVICMEIPQSPTCLRPPPSKKTVFLLLFLWLLFCVWEGREGIFKGWGETLILVKQPVTREEMIWRTFKCSQLSPLSTVVSVHIKVCSSRNSVVLGLSG